MSLPVCKFYLTNQKCRFGEHCRYLHSVDPKPPPLSRSTFQIENNGQAVTYKSSSIASSPVVDSSSHFINQKDEDIVNQFASLNPSARSFHPHCEYVKDAAAVVPKESGKQTGPQRKICQYFAQHGNCAFGRNCWFSHSIRDDSAKSKWNEQSNRHDTVSHLQSRDVPPRFQRQNRSTKTESTSNISEDIKGESDQEDSNLLYDKGLPNPKGRGSRPCHLFKYGKCRWGRHCRFSHSRSGAAQPFSHKNGGSQMKRDNDESLFEQKERSDVNPAEQYQNPGFPNSKPSVFKQVLTLDELEEGDIETYRQLDINYLKKRFPSSSSSILEDEDNFIFQGKFSPSDPDWSFDVKVFNLEFFLPRTYPKQGMAVKVLGEEEFPETVRRYLEVSISDWLMERRNGFVDRGKVELVARPFLRWLDRNIEDMTTLALQQLKRELVAKASGLEFIPAEKLRERYTSETGSAESESGSAESEEHDGASDENEGDSGDSDDESYSSDGSESEEEEKGQSLNLDPERKGTEISLRHLQLKEKATSLMFDRLKLILQCSRCKNHEEVIVMPGKVLSVTCGKCSHEMLTTYRASLAHQFSSVIGYLDLENCAAFDLIFQDCKANVTCLNCSKQTRIDGLVSGQLIDGWCQACNARFKIATEAVKFSHLAPSGIDIAGSTEVEVIKKKAKKPPKDPNIKEGSPLPEFGTCKHYKHSYRWLRFPCCGKAYPCDVCHDKAENHDMVFANRMICGYCCKEQAFASTLPCRACKSNLTKVHTAHWEGGSGCRDKISMSKSDIQKYKNMNKTISNHKKKVQSAGSKKKTTKLRHA